VPLLQLGTQKSPKKTVRAEKKTALKPVATGRLPEAIGLDEKHLPELPTYKPPLELRFEPSKSLATGLSELDTFQGLLTPAIVEKIVKATNSYVLNHRETDEDPDSQTRPWRPVNSTDIWRYIGCLFYMGYHRKGRHEEHWQESGYLNQFLSLTRFQQIHRYFTLRDEFIHPRQENETFAWQVEPIASTVKENCKAFWRPSSHLAIDEAMIAYRGRTSHKVKLPNKPIKEGYKVWVLGDNGYVYDWLWHSRIDGPEGIPQEGLDVTRVKKTELTELTTVHLAPTFALVIRLAQHLRQVYPTRVFCFFLDNLFLNLNVSQALLALRICCTGTTRKNAHGIPEWLIKLKEYNKGLVLEFNAC
jgi:Transposase IS4